MLARTREELLGLTVAYLTAPESIASCSAMMAGVAETGEAATVEKRYLRPDGGSAWASSSVSRVPGPDGRPLSFLAVVLDIAGRRRAEERQALLSQAVDHRAKNALPVVLAALSLTRAPDLPSYVRAIEGRVAALARAQTLLAEDSWYGADLETLLRGELTAFLADGGANTPQAGLSGPALTLPPGGAQPLAIAMHELATNAVEYDALSTAAGRPLIEWRVEGGEDGTLHLRWTETGSPAITRLPTRRGFGSRVLEGTVREQLGGQVSLSRPETSFVCDITVPLRPPRPPEPFFPPLFLARVPAQNGRDRRGESSA
ncbi:HWE histidine kinase domain-containing protein [Roseomonas sp. GCM10028921]